MATSFLGLVQANAAGPALVPLLGSAAILSFDYFEAIYFSVFVKARHDEISNTAIAKFWELSLRRSLASVFSLYGSTALAGALIWHTSERGGLLRKYAGLGALFTAGHFAYGYHIAKTIERMVEEPSWARTGQKRWLLIHSVRTMTADIPAFICFLSAVWHGW